MALAVTLNSQSETIDICTGSWVVSVIPEKRSDKWL